MPNKFEFQELEESPVQDTESRFDFQPLEEPLGPVQQPQPDPDILTAMLARQNVPSTIKSTTAGGPPISVSPANAFLPLMDKEAFDLPFAPLDPTPRINLSGLVPEVKPDDSIVTAASKTLAQAGLSLPEFFTSDAGITTLGLAPVKVLHPLVGAYWSQDLLRNAWKQAQESTDNWNKLTDAQKTQAILNVAISTGMGVGAAGLGMRPTLRKVSPKALGETVAKIPKGQEGAVTAIKVLEQAKTAPVEQVPVVPAAPQPAQKPETAPIDTTKAEAILPESAKALQEAGGKIEAAGAKPAEAAAGMQAGVEQRLSAGKAAPTVAAEAAQQRAAEAVKPGFKVEDYVEPEPTEVVVKAEEFAPQKGIGNEITTTKPATVEGIPFGSIEEGLNTEYPTVAEKLHRYTHDNDRFGIKEALSDSEYETYYDSLQRLLKYSFGDWIAVTRNPKYAPAESGLTPEKISRRDNISSEYVSVSTNPNWHGEKHIVNRKDVVLAGQESEGELIVKKIGLKPQQKGVPNAQAVPSNQAVIDQERLQRQAGQNVSGENLEQPAPGRSEPVGEGGQAKTEVLLEQSRDLVNAAGNLAKRKDIAPADKAKLGPLIEAARKGDTEPLRQEIDRIRQQYPRQVKGANVVKLFDRETEAVGGTDILDWIHQNMRLMSKTAAKKKAKDKFARSAGEYDDAPKLPVHHNERVYGGTARPDQVAQAAYEAKMLRDPSVVELWRAIGTASERRRKVLKGGQREADTLEVMADFEEKAKTPGSDKLDQPVEELRVGDSFEIEGQKIEVTQVEPDGTVILKDGSRWGTQTAKPGETLWVEKFEPKEQPKVESPKLRQGEKATGELFQGQDQPFNLAGETGIDTQRIAQEKAAAEKAASEAKAAQEKQQMRLSTIPPEQPKGPGMEPGPGAMTAGAPPDKSQIEQLAADFSQKAPTKQRAAALVRQSFDFGRRKAEGADLVSRAINALRTSGTAIWKAATGFEKPSELLQAKGDLSASLESRGWRVREFARNVKKALPDVRRRAAISKYIEAGGDNGELMRGEAETKPEFRAAYRDARNLTPEEKVMAENISNYFDARLQEAIDAGVLENGITDYIHRIYEKRPDFRDRALAYVQSGILSKNPSLAKKRLFQFDWEAEKLGYRPVQDFLPRVTDYETSLSRAIAAREFIAKLSTLRASDGRPIIGIKAVGVPIEDATGVREGTLIKPHGDFKKALDPTDTANYRGDYQARPDYRALSKWKWVSEDADGKPIFVQGDVAIHPEYLSRVDALLEPSKVRFGRYGKIGGPALTFGSTIKQTMLDLSMFHQVQIAVHGMEHRVWSIPGPRLLPGMSKIVQNIDFENPNVQGLLKGGVTLGGEYRGQHLGEGLVGSSLTRHIPGLGPIMESYHEWLFQSFIPRVKMTMALHALERNKQRYAKDLASGRMTDTDLNFLTAKQANAAFGELNYIMMERSKTTQDIARLIMLAPDFLEARAKFVGQALTKYGTEQRVALLLGALTLYTTARIVNKALDDQWHFEPENLFNVIYKNNAYSLRTVQGDVIHALTKPLQFWLNRLNPTYTRSLLELVSGRDQFGRKRDFWQVLGDTVSNVVPIALRSSRERSIWESMLNATGVTARRYNDVQEAMKLASEWKKKNNVREAPGEFVYDSDKDPLRPLKIALSQQDEPGTMKEFKRVLESKALKPEQVDAYFRRYVNAPFTGSKANEARFLKDLSGDERKTVQGAMQHRQKMGVLYWKARRMYYYNKTHPE